MPEQRPVDISKIPSSKKSKTPWIIAATCGGCGCLILIILICFAVFGIQLAQKAISAETKLNAKTLLNKVCLKANIEEDARSYFTSKAQKQYNLSMSKLVGCTGEFDIITVETSTDTNSYDFEEDLMIGNLAYENNVKKKVTMTITHENANTKIDSIVIE